MKTNKQLTAKVLEVKTIESGIIADPTRCKGSFNVLEFENGLILVPGESTNDWFFDDRDSIDACGGDIVTSVEETGETEEWTSEQLLRAIQESVKEFGVDSVPQKHLELWRK